MLLAGGLGGGAVVPATGTSATSGAGDPTVAPTPTPSGTRPPGPVPPIIDPELSLPGNPSDGLRDWGQQVAERTGIPMVAVLAYGYAELVVAHTTPECNLSWTTLAAIGRVESNHGHSGDSSLLPDGRAIPPIYGDPLDGEGGRMLIPDTDGGELDGDEVYDRAVGPMQFIPETWQLEAVDADGDGVADVHNIHDAALAAANYLCRGDRDLTVPADWWAAIHSYNNVSVYADAVFNAANEYGQLSRP
ncbi:lytic murein transglycosylase [Natronosporangium hydrolyticum]|uniref:Lytic murein transglycosylase n=2 Tax=Natronosporangium hydrolyticum TaxID=2811111 RepID=A0A895YGW6_9ACTN|nr:lytic murein transglycosylase [Natronosporangium hydrolyticum]